MRPAVAEALARLDARVSGPVLPAIEWQRWSSQERGRCQWCKRRSGLMVSSVVPIRMAPSYFSDGSLIHPGSRYSSISERCLDEVACSERRSKAYEQRSRRSGSFRWAQSRFEHGNAEKGCCAWCGEAIVYTAEAPYRVKQRQRHRGDEYEVGDVDCRIAYNRTYAHNARALVELRGDPCCVDCGVAEVWIDKPEWRDADPRSEGGWWQSPPWEADHRVPLEDGGEHSMTNIERRCCDCHRRKTARENAARREKRRVDKAQAAA